MDFFNFTHLDSARLEAMFRQFSRPYPLDDLQVRVRYTRSAPFSGSCQYSTRRIQVNIGRRNRYPYALKTYIARAETHVRGRQRYWSRPLYVVPLKDAYELALFLFLHELYHWLVRQAKRNTRQKEGRCDRFAVRALVEQMGSVVLGPDGQPVSRELWDFQDLDAFVAASLNVRRRRQPSARPNAPPVAARPALQAAARPAGGPNVMRQLSLFPC